MPNPANQPITRNSHCPPSYRSAPTSRKGGGRQKPKTQLTQETLEEFNKRNQVKNSKAIAFYQGLNDSTLYIAQQKLKTSPGSGSQHTDGSTSSLSTVIEKMQEWGTSCFRRNNDKINNTTVCSSKGKKSESFSSITIKEAFEQKRKELKPAKVVVVESSSCDEKSLRERVSTSAPVIQPPPPPIVAEQKARVIKEKAKAVLVEQKARAIKEKPKEVQKIEKRFVWADNYRPKALKDFICNRNKAEELIAAVEAAECSHYIFEGPHGVGKRTMVWALLKEAFGADRQATKKVCKEFVMKGEAQQSIKVNIQISARQVEVNASELGGYEKHVVMELIKENHINEMGQVEECHYSNCHAIILHEADKLSADAQLYIRWLMEKNKGCSRIFFCCHDASKLQTIKSLCKVVQLLPPSDSEIVEVLEFIAKQEQIELPRRLAERIAENSLHNLRQAIRSFEASWQLNCSLTEDQVILTGWEEDIASIAQSIIDEQSPKQLYVIRGKLQSLIEHNVSPDFIFHTLAVDLKKFLGEKCHSKVDALYQEYNRDSGGVSNNKLLLPVRHSNGQSDRKRKNLHQFLKIEEFTARFMSWYKSSVLSGMGCEVRSYQDIKPQIA